MPGEPGIPRLLFWGAAAAVVIGIGATIWVSVPGPDTRHDLRSPSGRVLLQVAEDCAAGPCRRVIILEADGARRGCPVRISGTTPVFVEVTPRWSADESGVVLDYADAVGRRGALTLVFVRDCTET